jgi:predicted MarR family transcription regulator
VGTKNHTYSITKMGERLTNEYSKLRSDILMRKFRSLTDFDERVTNATELLSIITGIYTRNPRALRSRSTAPATTRLRPL